MNIRVMDKLEEQALKIIGHDFILVLKVSVECGAGYLCLPADISHRDIFKFPMLCQVIKSL